MQINNTFSCGLLADHAVRKGHIKSYERSDFLQRLKDTPDIIITKSKIEDLVKVFYEER